MRNVLLAAAIALLLILGGVNAGSSSASAGLHGLQLVTQLPAEVPQRITGFTYDGEKLLAPIYQGRGSYVTLDPLTLQWTVHDDVKQRQAIIKVTGPLNSPTAVCFVDGKLWFAGGEAQSFGLIDPQDWNVERIFSGKNDREDAGTKSYSSMTYDGANLWVAWHWCKYDIPASETQRLLKIDPDTGTVIAAYPLPAGSAPDLTHGLAWDGSRLWHAKDNSLSAIDPVSGGVTAQYTLPKVKRPSGMAWDGRALWIIEFDGKVWRLTV